MRPKGHKIWNLSTCDSVFLHSPWRLICSLLWKKPIPKDIPSVDSFPGGAPVTVVLIHTASTSTSFFLLTFPITFSCLMSFKIQRNAQMLLENIENGLQVSSGTWKSAWFSLCKRTAFYVWLVVPKGKCTSGTHHRVLGISNYCLSSAFPRTMSHGRRVTKKLVEAETSCALRALLHDGVARVSMYTIFCSGAREEGAHGRTWGTPTVSNTFYLPLWGSSSLLEVRAINL